MSKKFKKETIDEFLARGGVISKLPAVPLDKNSDPIKATSASGPVVILSMEEADLYYGEARKGSVPKKAKSSAKIDINALPESLRIKYINRLKENIDGEDFEEDQDDISSRCRDYKTGDGDED